MPRYYFHLWSGGQLAPDETGRALPGPDAARRRAEAMIARLTGRSPFMPEDWSGCDIEVTDDAGRTVLLLPFADAGLSPAGKRAA